MPWTDVPDFTVGQVLTSSRMNQMRNNDNIGHRICTSTTRPASPDEGTMIYETDTDKVYVWTGAAWVQVRQTNDSVDGSLLTGTVATSLLTGTVANANLPDGAPTWYAVARAAFPSGSGQSVFVSITVPYKSEVMLTASASAYGGTGLARTYVAISGVTGWIEGSYYYFNFGGDHRTTPTAAAIITVNAGTYSMGCLQSFTTDANDQATFMVFGRKVT